MKRLSYLSLLPAIVIAGLSTTSALAATGPQLYAVQGTGTSLTLHVNPAGTSIDTVQVNVNFSDKQLQFTGLDMSGSSFTTAVPAQPQASSGKLSFSVAKLAGQPITTDAVVARVLFKSLATSGSAQVAFTGSSAASKGMQVPISISPASLSLAAASSSPGAVRISAIKPRDVTNQGATIAWTTNVPTSSSIVYGLTSKYGFSVGSANLTTTHSLDLGNKFTASSTVHYQITAVDAQSNSAMSGDKTLTTSQTGSPLHINTASHQHLWRNLGIIVLAMLAALAAFEVLHKLHRRSKQLNP